MDLFDKWREPVLSLLKADASFEDYFSVLIKMKEDGLSSHDAEVFFTEIMMTMRNEENEKGEDLILEVLDIVTGYCSENSKIW